MQKLGKILLAGSLLLTAVGAFAQDEEAVEYGWEGKGEFGFVSTTGNTESIAVNMKLEFIKTSYWARIYP